jgi:hypothetical protein
MTHRTTMRPTGRRTTVIFGTTSHLTTGVVSYRAAMRATRRPPMRTTESMRRHDTMAGELARTSGRRYTGVSVVER